MVSNRSADHLFLTEVYHFCTFSSQIMKLLIHFHESPFVSLKPLVISLFLEKYSIIDVAEFFRLAGGSFNGWLRAQLLSTWMAKTDAPNWMDLDEKRTCTVAVLIYFASCLDLFSSVFRKRINTQRLLKADPVFSVYDAEKSKKGYWSHKFKRHSWEHMHVQDMHTYANTVRPLLYQRPASFIKKGLPLWVNMSFSSFIMWLKRVKKRSSCTKLSCRHSWALVIVFFIYSCWYIFVLNATLKSCFVHMSP